LNDLIDEYRKAMTSESENDASAAINARTAEAVRMFVRDAQLAAPFPKINLEDVKGLLNAAIRGFDVALGKLRKTPPQDEKAFYQQQAWILAHKGATLTLLVWLGFLRDETDEVSFEQARKCFREAQEIFPKNTPPGRYDWCIQFEAFVLALHGTNQDFFEARDKLATLVDDKGQLQSNVHRSRAMLNSYIVANDKDSLKTRKAAASESIESGLLGAAADSEDDKVLYNCASSSWMLSRVNDQEVREALAEVRTQEKEKALTREQALAHVTALSEAAKSEKELLQQNIKDFIESAQTRAQDQASQAIFVLTGLALLRALTSTEQARDKAIEEANRFAQLLQGEIPPGLEALAMFRRDPVFQTIRTSDDEACRYVRERFNPNYDVLRQAHCDRFSTK
jgi:hypothetical protein